MTARRSVAAHRLRRRRWPWLLAFFLLAGLVALDRSGLLLAPAPDDLAHYDGRSVRVLRVISPHTLDIELPDPVQRRSTTRVRLWGLNAPLPATAQREAEPGADQAMMFVESLVDDQRVTLHLEPDRPRDSLGRVLAHVGLRAGGTLNEDLLEAGWATVDERWPHGRLAQYAQAEHRARRHERGLWGEIGR